MSQQPLLIDFQIIRPEFESPQEKTLDWLVEAHTTAEKDEQFKSSMKEKLWHVGCKPTSIAKRGHVLRDFLHTNWSEMEVYRLDTHPEGKDLSCRTEIFQRETEKIFDQYYPETSAPPNDLIHVSCTGYASPSGAQKIVSKRGWGQLTTVTHAYHMGCYGSIPAIRMGMGFLAGKDKNIDIVHTEICSLHSNPLKHKADQLVSQSLFADGFIKYSMTSETDQTHLRIMNVKEEIIPSSTKAMTWNVAGWGFEMSLAKEIPVLINRALPGYLERLGSIKEDALFAIHPGGPKILLHIQELLHLKDSQMAYSFEILKNYGNMSSATLPHIWHKILNDPNVKSGTQIVSLAFGPGLSIAGSIMEKVCGL